MAITHQSATSGSGFAGTATETLSLPGTVAAGDLLIVASANTGITVNTPTDNKGGNTYTQLAAQVVTGSSVTKVWYCVVVNGGSSFQVTVTTTVAANGHNIVHRVSGTDTVAPLDQFVAGNIQSAPGTATDAITSTAK